jgi:hypothetical protein
MEFPFAWLFKVTITGLAGEMPRALQQTRVRATNVPTDVYMN